MSVRQNHSIASVRTHLPIELSGREFHLETRAYLCQSTGLEAIALLHRKTSAFDATCPLVAIRRGCVAGDIFHSLRCDCHRALKMALDAITAAPLGVLVYLPDLSPKLTINRHAEPKDDAESPGEHVADLCIDPNVPSGDVFHRLAIQIIRDFGFSDIRLFASDVAFDALSGHGLRIVEKISLNAPRAAHDSKGEGDFTIVVV